MYIVEYYWKHTINIQFCRDTTEIESLKKWVERDGGKIISVKMK